MRRDPTRPGRRRRLNLAALGLGLALALAACGGSPEGDGVASLGGAGSANDNSSETPSASKDPQQRALDFAKCMREHGIDMPDPEVDDQGRIKVRVGAGGAGKRPDPKKLEAAQKACGSLMGGGDGPAQLDPEDRDAMVAFAKCMREHGIDMPDPTDGGLTVRKEAGGGGVDPESKEFQEAEKACNHHLANLRPKGESGGRS
jgi:hypothetical protein